MIAYVDASVLLRVALRQPDALPEWRDIQQGVSSALIMTESLRTLDRLRLRANLPDTEVASRRAAILQLIASLELVEIDAVILDRAAQPMPTELGTLDAIHLASALLWKEMSQAELTVATHDGALGLAARAHGLPVVGVKAQMAIESPRGAGEYKR
jgi:predicted nucleic acid-binding protein